MPSKTAIILCGALGREITDLVKKHGWEVDLYGIAAHAHLYPETIAPLVEKKITEIQEGYAQIIVAYGDCGSYGALDQALAHFPDIQRLPGPHCYQWYAGDTFQKLMDDEPGTFFLTDFLVRAFHGTIIKGLGLDRRPQLKGDYFGNYSKVIFLKQSDDPSLDEKAQAAADYLGLPLTTIYTGYGDFERDLMRLVGQPSMQ